MSDEKGTCCVCGGSAPDSVVCDGCFLKNWVKPTFAAIAKARAADPAPGVLTQEEEK